MLYLIELSQEDYQQFGEEYKLTEKHALLELERSIIGRSIIGIIGEPFSWQIDDGHHFNLIVEAKFNQLFIIGKFVYRYSDYYLNCKILEILVFEEHRGRGVGRRLLMDFLNLSKNLGSMYVNLSVLNSKELAIGLYTSLGFEEWKTLSTGKTLIKYL